MADNMFTAKVVFLSERSWYNEIIREQSDTAKYGQDTADTTVSGEQGHQQIKLDEMMHVLFTLSDRVTLHVLNHLFNETFTVNDAVIEYGNSKFIEDNFGRIVGDLFITVRQHDNVYRYHIEFQTLHDTSMAIRMFHYGFEKALEEAGTTNINENTILEFPKQLVIFLEENENIHSTISFQLRLPDGQLVAYTVPVMKYWEYSATDLRAHKLYALLPLQVIKSRKKIQAIERSKRTIEEKGRLITEQFNQLKDTIHEVIQVLDESHDEQELSTGELGKVLDVLTYLTNHLYERYGEYRIIEEEVGQMWKTVYDPKVFEEGKREGESKGKQEIIASMIQEGFDDEVIARVSKWSLEEIREIRQSDTSL